MHEPSTHSAASNDAPISAERVTVTSTRGIGPLLMAGVLSGLVSMSIGVSLASLIFNGPLATSLPLGVGLVLVSGLVVGLIAAVTSSFPGMMAGVQGSTAAVLALATAGVVSSVAPEQAIPTVVATISVTSLSVGVLFYVLGRFQLGGLIRYIPFPVIAGFLSGTGALVIKGAMGVLGQGRDLGSFTEPDSVIVWGAGVAMAVVLAYGSRHAHRLAVPLALLLAPLAFHAGAAAFGVGVNEAQDRGWLLGRFPDGALWQPSTVEAVGSADWGAIWSQAGTLASVLLLATITLLLNVPAIELETHREIDINQDLKGLGLANLVTAAAGGAPAYPYLSNTVLAARISDPNRSAAIVAALLNGVALLFGASVFSLLPVAVVGAVLLFIGGTFVYEWAWETRRRLTAPDYALILLITFLMVVAGFVQGVVVGLLWAVFLFVYRYSKVNMIRHETRVPEYPSNVDRPRGDRSFLQVAGQGTLVMELHGFLFFGTSTRLIDRVRARLASPHDPALRFLVLDFRSVTGIDSSAVMSFEKLSRLSRDRSFAVLITGLADNLRLPLGHLLDEEASGFRSFADLDRGLQWCEEALLAERPEQATVRAMRLGEALSITVPECTDPAILDSSFQRLDLPAGGRLIEMGTPSTGLFFLEEGTVTAHLERADGPPLRLRTMHAGTVVGEIGLYANTVSTASVVAETDCVVRLLCPDEFARLSSDDPDSAAVLHLFIARILADRVAADNRSIEALRR